MTDTFAAGMSEADAERLIADVKVSFAGEKDTLDNWRTFAMRRANILEADEKARLIVGSRWLPDDLTIREAMLWERLGQFLEDCDQRPQEAIARLQRHAKRQQKAAQS